MKKRLDFFSTVGYVGIIVVAMIAMCYFWWNDRHTFCFSRESGFYEEPFELQIGVPHGNKVFYTLDGSDPTIDSMEYTSPIYIDDASNNPNVYSSNIDVVTWYDEVNAPYHFSVPKEPIDKCNIVKAICVDEDGTVVDEIQASYFVDFQSKRGYDGLWICSVITDPDNLFNPKDGIMVHGDAMEKVEDRYINTNFSQRGIEWERRAFVQFFDTERENVLSQICGIRIHGNTTCAKPTKSFSLYSRDEYDGHDKFLYDFWGDGYYADKIMLLSGGQDSLSLIRDKLVSDLTREYAFSSYHYVPCILFIDGEYWGIHYITEKYDPEYFKHYFGTEKEDLFVLKDFMQNPEWALREGVFDMEEDRRKWNDFAVCISGREEMGLTQELFEKTFDYDSFLDYFATEIYVARNGDWPPLNMSYWSSKSYGSSPNDGKWRFLLYDIYYDSMTQPEHDTISYARDQFALFDYEMNNDQFVSDFYARLNEIGEEVFNEENVEEYLDEHYELMNESIMKHYRRFYGNSYDEDTFYSSLEEIKQFFVHRKTYISEQINR